MNTNNGSAGHGALADILALFVVFILSGTATGAALGWSMASGFMGREFGFFLAYVLNLGIAVGTGLWLIKRRGYPPVSWRIVPASGAWKILPPAVVMMFAVSILLEPLLALFPDSWLDAVRSMVGDGRSVWTALSLVVAAPILEEVLFRGVIQGIAVNGYGATRGIVLSSVVFGIAHFTVPQQAVNALAIALVLGFVCYRTQSVVPSVILHGINNLIAYLFALAGHEDAMLSDLLPGGMAYWTVYAVCAVAVAAISARLCQSVKSRQQ